jgi:hypothetical protein
VQQPERPLSESLTGTWKLVSRQTRTASGRMVPSPLGEDPIALLIYDGRGNFSAQFMKRDRQTKTSEVASEAPAVLNNTRPVGEYDAYFGRYVVDDAEQTVTQTLVGSLSPDNIGQVVTRQMSVEGDDLTIRVEIETADREPAVITLKWRRLS